MALAISLSAKDKKKSDFLTYKGSFFEIDYPKNFSVKPSIPGSIPKLYDSAFFESKDGQMRSYQETTNEEETTKLIIGIEYSDRDSYKKYKDEYLKFKKSIRQFAD